MVKKITNFVLHTLHKKLHSLNRTNEGGNTIRQTRLKKFKKSSKKLILAAKIVAIWYLLILTGSFLTSDTGAYFNDVEVIENSIHVQWPEQPTDEVWDRSSLKFSNLGGFCSKDYPGQIYSEIVNGGSGNMAGTTKYFLYRVDIGAAGPNKNNLGELVAHGDVPSLQSGKSTILIYKPENISAMKPGVYKFKANQRPNHSNPNNNPNKETDQETWGQGITITQEDITNCQTN